MKILLHPALALVMLATSATCFGQNLADLAGTWNAVEFTTPNTMPVTYASGTNIVSNLDNKTNFSVSSFPLSVDSSGGLTFASGTGTLSIVDQGLIKSDLSTGDHLLLTVNSTEDLMTDVEVSLQQMNCHVIAKAPASISASDIVGTWTISAFDTPAVVTQTLDAVNPYLTDVQPSSSFKYATGTITFNSDGSSSGTLFDPFTGTWSVGSSAGSINVSITNGPTFTAYMNASKDTIVAVDTSSSSPDLQELTILTKAPTTMAAADFEGVWRMRSFVSPNQPAVIKNTSGYVTDLSSWDQFSVSEPNMDIGNDGFLVGRDDNLFHGTETPGSGGSIGVAIAQGGGTANYTMQTNASENFIVGVMPRGSNQQIMLATKSPAWSGRLETGLQTSQSGTSLNLLWAASTNRVIQESSDLVNWADVSGTNDTHSFSADLTAHVNHFYRVYQH